MASGETGEGEGRTRASMSRCVRQAIPAPRRRRQRRQQEGAGSRHPLPEVGPASGGRQGGGAPPPLAVSRTRRESPRQGIDIPRHPSSRIRRRSCRPSERPSGGVTSTAATRQGARPPVGQVGSGGEADASVNGRREMLSMRPQFIRDPHRCLRRPGTCRERRPSRSSRPSGGRAWGAPSAVGDGVGEFRGIDQRRPRPRASAANAGAATPTGVPAYSPPTVRDAVRTGATPTTLDGDAGALEVGLGDSRGGRTFESAARCRRAAPAPGRTTPPSVAL